MSALLPATLLSLFRYSLMIVMVFSATLQTVHAELPQNTHFKEVVLSDFIDQNQISDKLAAKKHRVMLKPSAITFSGQLMARPKPGKFSLVYDALGLWGSGEMPAVTHSAYIGADDDRVIGVYVSDTAAAHFKSLPVGKPLTLYAVHIYNYANGPRLVILGAGSAPAP